jgi:DNA-binding transcriptional LysR family regulator
LQECRLEEEHDLKVVLPWSQHSIRGMLDAFIRAGQIPAKRVVEMDSLSAMLDFVHVSYWVTFLPVTAVSRCADQADIIVQPVTEPAMSCEFYLIHPARRVLSPAAKAFAELIEMGFQQSAVRWSKLLATRG